MTVYVKCVVRFNVHKTLLLWQSLMCLESSLVLENKLGQFNIFFLKILDIFVLQKEVKNQTLGINWSSYEQPPNEASEILQKYFSQCIEMS